MGNYSRNFSNFSYSFFLDEEEAIYWSKNGITEGKTTLSILKRD